MPFYQAKPVVVNAIQYDGHNERAGLFVGRSFEITTTQVGIQGPGGFQELAIGDYIVKDHRGHCRVLTEERFLEQYVPL